MIKDIFGPRGQCIDLVPAMLHKRRDTLSNKQKILEITSSNIKYESLNVLMGVAKFIYTMPGNCHQRVFTAFTVFH